MMFRTLSVLLLSGVSMAYAASIEAQTLAFKAVFLDTPVAFLPDEKSAAEQERTLRQARTRKKVTQVTYGPAFNEGGIAMTVHIAPAPVRRESVELAWCLAVAEVCEPLLVWNSELQQYSETLTVYDLPDEIEKSVYVELLIPGNLREKLLTQPNEAQKYTIYVSNLNGNNADELVEVVQIPIIDLNDQARAVEQNEISKVRRAARSCPANASTENTLYACREVRKARICEKSFGKYFSNGTFGVGFETTTKLWAYQPGTSVGAIVEVTPTLFSNKLSDFAKAEAVVIKNQGKLLTGEASITTKGKEVYSYNLGRTIEYNDKTEKYEHIWKKCTQITSGACSKPPENVLVAGEGGEAEDENIDVAPIFTQQRMVTQKAEKYIMVVFIPVKLSGTVIGTVASTINAGVDVYNDSLAVNVEGGPSSDITTATTALTYVLVGSMDVEEGLTLIKNDAKLNVTTTLPFDLDAVPTFKGEVTNGLQGPYGDISLIAKWLELAFAMPPWQENESQYDLISWASFNKDFTLLKWGDEGCEEAGQTAADIPSATADGLALPEFTNKEPLDSANRWVCLYSDIGFRGQRACFEIPPEYQEVAFNADYIAGLPKACSRDWCDKAIKSLKIWGPLRVSLLRDEVTSLNDYSLATEGAVWYAKSGSQEEVEYIGDILADRIKSVVISQLPEGAYYSSMNFCLHEHSNTEGHYFCKESLKEEVEETLSGSRNQTYNSITLGGLGVVCLSSDYGNEICLAGIGSKLTVDLAQYESWNGQVSRYKVLPMRIPYPGRYAINHEGDKTGGWSWNETTEGDTYYRAFFLKDVSRPLNEESTSSLPLVGLTGIGELSGYYVPGDANLSNYDASVLAIVGPATLELYSEPEQAGRKMIYYLDDGEWDVTYLYGFNDDTRSFSAYNYKRTYIKKTNPIEGEF